MKTRKEKFKFEGVAHLIDARVSWAGYAGTVRSIRYPAKHGLPVYRVKFDSAVVGTRTRGHNELKAARRARNHNALLNTLPFVIGDIVTLPAIPDEGVTSEQAVVIKLPRRGRMLIEDGTGDRYEVPIEKDGHIGARLVDVGPPRSVHHK
jgi:hypothetical protein